MAAIYLIRHSQASFGSSDYDQLSEVGLCQARVLGDALAVRRVPLSRAVCGTMRRHHQTATGCLEAMGRPAEWTLDAGWNEYDHDDVICAFEPRYRDPACMMADLAASAHPRKTFQEMFVRAVARWASGKHDAEYTETWSAFRERVRAALERVNASLGKSEGAVVFTSGGPIGAVCGALLHLNDADTLRLSSRLANAAITKLVCSDGAIYLSTLNEHGHFEGEHAAMMTYR
jgi:broad specificity phosphatase PhoE